MTYAYADSTPEQKRELLARLLRERSQYEHVGPLSHGQRSLWFMHQLDRASSAYNIMFAAHVRGGSDREALRRALQSLVDRHAVLRTVYETEGGRPVQRVRRRQELELEIVDARGASFEALSERIEQRADAPFDLERGPVLRAILFDRGGEDALLLASHHIAMDFWSYDLLVDELEALYRAHANGSTVMLPPPNVSYAYHVKRQEAALDGEAGAQAWLYWSNQLANLPPELDLPTDRPRPPRQTFAGATHRFRIPDTSADGLRRLAESQGATLYATLLTAFFVLLHRYSGQEDILVGSPTAGRNSPELEGLLGYFLNPIVIRARPTPETTFSQLLTEVRETVIAGLAHQDFPFALLVERLQPRRDASRSPLFQVAFNWDKPRRSMGAAPSSGGGLDLEPFAFAQQGAAFDLTLMMLDSGGELAAALQYNTELFESGTIARMLRHFQVLLAGIVADPHRRLSDLPLLGVVERRVQLEDWNATRADYPRQSTLPELLEACASRDGDAIAVEHEGDRLTHRELHARADRLAAFLRERGVGRDTIVALCLPPSLDMVVGLLGVLKSGGAYLPLDPSQPPERLRLMIEDARPHVILTQTDLAPMLPGNDAQLVRLDADRHRIERAAAEGPRPRAEDRAYVIYTSGSTGGPKGVQISHRALVNFLTAMSPLLGPDDVLAAVTTLSFDIAALEIFGPLLAGGRTILVSSRTAADGVRLAECLRDGGVNVLQATPATWRLLLRAGWSGGKRFKALCGGDVLPPSLADQLLEHCGELWNLYGPTETTVWSTLHKVDAVNGRASVPIGRPIANTQIYILDSERNPMPIGVPGELFIGGDGLADGYLNRPELNREKFVAHPFAEPGTRLYRTGDVARYLPDGNVELLGRTDHQVKINGYRIELAEIETELARHELVREAVVVARDDGESGAKRLVAYITGAPTSPPGLEGEASDELNVSALRDLLGTRLPAYMLPSRYVFMRALPLTPNGKVDRSALPAQDDRRPTLAKSYLPPRDDVEQRLAQVWSRVLELDRVGVTDNFFELGGASAEALEVVAALESLGLTIPPSALFEHQTVAELAEAARRYAAAGAAPARPMPSERLCDELVAQRPSACQAAASTTPLDGRDRTSNLIIESLGVYLPESSVSTEAVLAGCHTKILFPLEGMTGIRSRRVAAGEEYSIDLARKAISECLRRSRYGASDIDLLICCSISRCDGPGNFSFEPCTAVKLRKDCGFTEALAFDVSNACAGMFTAIMVADALLKAGQIRRAMIVSGEYISHLIDSAQREIGSFLDSRLACLTVGDAGAAVIVERSAEARLGFHDIDMYTLGKYSSLCIAKISDQLHGGAIMYTDAIKQTSVAAKNAVMHSMSVFERCGWSPESFDRVILHQTSETALRDVARALDRKFGKPVCHDGNMVYNLAHRGNTATTSHFVALDDLIREGQLRSGEKIVFGISGSGQTVGTALYTLDDLPDRMRRPSGTKAASDDSAHGPPMARSRGARVRISAVGTVEQPRADGGNAIELARHAAENCLRRSIYERSELELLIYAGVYRDEFLAEPAMAALLAGALAMNADIRSHHDPKTFVFDVFNGAVGFLNACHVASCLILSRRFRTAMIATAEIENNADYAARGLRGLAEAGAALILEEDSTGRIGFGQFVFRYALEHIGALTAHTVTDEDGRTHLAVEQDPRIEQHYLDAAESAVDELLEFEGLERSRIAAVIGPQISSRFTARLAERLGIPADRCVDAADERGDLLSCAIPYALRRLVDAQRVASGDAALIVSVGSGVQVGCAAYYF